MLQSIGQNWSWDPSSFTRDAERYRQAHGGLVERCCLCHSALAAPHTEPGASDDPTKECKAWPLPLGRSQYSFKWESNPYSNEGSARVDTHDRIHGNKTHNNKGGMTNSV